MSGRWEAYGADRPERNTDEFSRPDGMAISSQPAAVVEGPITEGTLDLLAAFRRARRLTRSALKFTVTGPAHVEPTLLDHITATGAIWRWRWPASWPSSARDGSGRRADRRSQHSRASGGRDWAVARHQHGADAVRGVKAVHLCFGNYGGQTIQKGTWERLIAFLNQLHADHFVLEMARRGGSELTALRGLDAAVRHRARCRSISRATVVETPDEIARRDRDMPKTSWAKAACAMSIRIAASGCCKRSIADRKMQALVAGRNASWESPQRSRADQKRLLQPGLPFAHRPASPACTRQTISPDFTSSPGFFK